MPLTWSVPTVTQRYSTYSKDCSSQTGENIVSPWTLRPTRRRKVQPWSFISQDVIGPRDWRWPGRVCTDARGSAMDRQAEHRHLLVLEVFNFHVKDPEWVSYTEWDGSRVYAYWMLTDIKSEVEESAFSKLWKSASLQQTGERLKKWM